MGSLEEENLPKCQNEKIETDMFFSRKVDRVGGGYYILAGGWDSEGGETSGILGNR